MIYHVDCSAPGGGDGTEGAPFRSIGMAALLAGPGDTVLVGPGIYRETVRPANAGREDARIIYKSRIPGGAVITGAEEITGWTRLEGDMWTASVPNGIFTGRNPYATEIFGDWYTPNGVQHTGELYFNGRSMYEARSMEEVRAPRIYAPSWEPELSLWKWYARVLEDKTVFYANFQGEDPNENTTEINVRQTCFWPERTGRDYITVSGFVITKAATNWAPPTAFQEGMIGPHWSRGWIIENCEISHSKCVGISLGKYLQPNNENKWTRFGRRVGTQNQRDAVCQARNEGWDRESVGGHVVRDCHIHHCGQAGIAGHLGAVFSVIENNHIHHINTKQLLTGAEIGGIKLHAAIDTVIRSNHIHHCTRGIWLDWEAQGTRVTGNLLHDNVTPEQAEVSHRLGTGEDLFIEISHGPTLIDNNIFLSPYACRLSTQGAAFVNNLFRGSFTMIGYGHANGGANSPHIRYTPYHLPHSTAIAGFTGLRHGDMRFFNNIFIQNPADYSRFEPLSRFGFPVNSLAGTAPYELFPTAEEFEMSMDDENYYDIERYYRPLPVTCRGNVYLGGARPTSKESDAAVDGRSVTFDLEERGGGWTLTTDLYGRELPLQPVIRSGDLGCAMESEARFEEPDGGELVLDRDMLGAGRAALSLPGPLSRPVDAIDLSIGGCSWTA